MRVVHLALPLLVALGVLVFAPITAAAPASGTNTTATHANTGTASPLVQLVAVQMTLSLNDYWTPQAFEAKIRSLMDKVADKTKPELPTLVVFPEDVGLMLVVQGMQDKLKGIETIGAAIEKATKAYMLPVAWTKITRGLSWVPALYLYRNGTIARTYFDVFSRVAKDYGVYLVAGSVVLPPYEVTDGEVQWQKGPQESRVYNTSYLFGPDGKVIGRQQKVYLIELEEKAALDLAHGRVEKLQVFDTAVGKVGIGICLDSFRDDVVDALAARGAEILVQPSANPGLWSMEQQADWMNGSYNRVYNQKHFTYAINPMMNGPLWDIAFFGQSGIVGQAPQAAGELHYRDLPAGPGFLALANADNTEEVVMATVPHP